MKSKLLKGVFTASIMCLVLSGSLADARPGGPGHGGPGFRPAVLLPEVPVFDRPLRLAITTADPGATSAEMSWAEL